MVAQRRSERSGWKIKSVNSGKAPFEGDKSGLTGRKERVVIEELLRHDNLRREAGVIVIDVWTPMFAEIPAHITVVA